MIQNIIFDFGKVLVTYEFHAKVDSWGMTPAQRKDFDDTILSEEWTLKIDQGEKTFREYIDLLKGLYPHLAPFFQKFYDHYEEFITGEMPGMSDLLHRLKEKGYKLYGLTNWSDSIYPILKKYPIFNLLDGKVISSEEKLIKPDAAIYHRLLEKYSLKAEECVFIDDKWANVEGSRNAGIPAIWFKNAAQLEEELRALL